MTSVRRALAFSISERYVLIAISLASNVLLARLLTPEEIGLYSVSLAMISVAQVIRDFGIGSFLIQSNPLTEARIRTAFGFSLALGTFLFVVTALLSPYAGRFYDDDRVTTVVQICALNFLVLPFCSISMSLLRRELLFNRVAAVGLSAAIVGFGVTVALAFMDFGELSMALGALVTNIVTGFGAWIARKDRKILLPSLSEWRALLSFGSRVSLTSVITALSINANELVVGKVLGFGPVAIMSRAQGMMNLFHRDLMTAIRSVAFPAFARAHRNNEDVEKQHVFSVGAITVFAWPFYAFTSLYALELLRIMFGTQWDSAADLVPWFCLAGAAGATCNLVIYVGMALGRVDVATKIDLILQPVTAVVLAGVAIAFKSLHAVAISFALISIASVPFHYAMKNRFLKTDFHAMLIALRPSALVTFISITPAVLFHEFGPYDGKTLTWPYFALTAGLYCMTWAVSLFIVQHPITNDPALRERLEKITLMMRLRTRE